VALAATLVRANIDDNLPINTEGRIDFDFGFERQFGEKTVKIGNI